jgi:preprotein translocase subunit SecA
MFSFLSSLLGDPSTKKLHHYEKELIAIKKIEVLYREEILSIEQIQAKTHEFQTQFIGLDIDNPDDLKEVRKRLEDIKYSAFALHRRACELIYGKTFVGESGESVEWHMIPYDVQLVGALALHDGNIAEMRTGE